VYKLSVKILQPVESAISHQQSRLFAQVQYIYTCISLLWRQAIFILALPLVYIKPEEPTRDFLLPHYTFAPKQMKKTRLARGSNILTNRN